MKSQWRDICIALAGIMQAVTQVERIAKTGYLDTKEFETAVKSLFVANPNTALEVYDNNVVNLQHGLEALEGLLANYRQVANSDLFRYALGVMHIQKKLKNKTNILSIIAERLQRADIQTQHFGSTHDNVIRNIADTYSDTISKFQYRIQVSGDYNYLQQDRVANQIRALLLAAIRAATLWRQLGGSRWQFLWHRDAIMQACHELIKEAKEAQFSGAA